MPSSRSSIAGLYVITDSRLIPQELLAERVAQAIEGGARIVQYRNKGAEVQRRKREARALAGVCHDHHVLFLVNDDAMLAELAGADGVHLGQSDASVAAARAVLGAGAIIGVSCHSSLELATRAEQEGADYVAFGRFFPSHTKPHAPPADLDIVRVARRTLRIPIVAIGGITLDNGAALVEAGADALAVIHGVFGQADVRAAAMAYAELFESRRHTRTIPKVR